MIEKSFQGGTISVIFCRKGVKGEGTREKTADEIDISVEKKLIQLGFFKSQYHH